MPRRRKRLDPSVFNLPVDAIRAGEFTDPASMAARENLLKLAESPNVTLQVAAEHGGVVAGVDEALAILKQCADDWSALSVQAMFDGDLVEPWETVMTIEGPYAGFAHLEKLVQGVLARRTRVATGARALSEAARIKPVLLFPGRHDHLLMQSGDLIAAQAGGVLLLWSDRPPALRAVVPALALVPHSYIAAMGGVTTDATRAFADTIKPRLSLIVPVDFENDAVGTSVAVARALEDRLWGVWLGTPDHLVDRSIIPMMGTFHPTGVNDQLVWNVRNALDAEGYGDVKILVAGGLGADRIRQYEEEGVPIDAYGVGSTTFAARAAFAADIVKVNGSEIARAGRSWNPNSRMERVK
jgi:nicotinate phosphoribosyltransferase